MFKLFSAAILAFLLSADNAIAGGTEAPAASAPKTATVVIYRPKATYGFMWKIHVRDNDGENLKVRNNSVQTLSVAPGQRTFSIRKELQNKSATVNVEDGKTYYLRVALRAGIGFGVPEIIEVTEATAKSEMQSLTDED